MIIDAQKFIRDLILEISEQVRLENDGKNDWIKVSNRLGSMYGIVKTPNACKKMYQRAQKNNKVEHESTKIKQQDSFKQEKHFASISNNADGTTSSERVINLSETDMKNPKFVLEAHGFDANEWDIVSTKNNFWTGHSSEDGQIINYQSKITVKPKVLSNELTKEDILDIVANFKPIERDFRLKSINTNGKEKLALEISFSDIHIGSFSWNQEVGQDYDMKIAIDKIKKVVEEAKEIIELYPIEKLYLTFLGDFVHIDTVDSTTTKGTKVDSDSRPKKILQKSQEVVVYIIEQLSTGIDTELYWIEGNHSRLLEYSIFMSLPLIFKNNKYLKFHVEPISRKAFLYKGNLVGLTHGEVKKNEQFLWLQSEFKELWGQSTYAEIHSGHLHQEIETSEKGGIIQRTNPTIKEQDLYEFENGWKSYKAVVAYLWSEKENLKAKFYLR